MKEDIMKKVKDKIPDIKPCPCGETPKYLSCTDNGQGHKWAIASCGECGVWSIEFRNKKYSNSYHSKAMQILAIEAWNSAPRGE